MYTRVLNMPFSRNSNLQKTCAPAPADALLINEEQLFVHKKQQKGETILRIDNKGSFIWGKIEKRKKFGIGYSVFIVGGIHLAPQGDLRELFDALFKKYGTSFAEIISCKLNTLNDCLKKWNKAPSLNGFIYYNLNMPENIKLNLMFGSIDVF